MPDQGFSKSRRLADSKEFQNVFDNVEVKAGNSHVLLLASTNTLGHPRLGLIVAKKKIRLAVNRNRFKRLVREHFRELQHQLSPIDIIAMARADFSELEASEQNRLVKQVFDRLLTNS